MRTIVVGAGFAGVSTALHLALRGRTGIVVLEREPGPGMHASGRNAGLLRRSSSDPVTARLLREGAKQARRTLEGIPGAIGNPGSLILGRAVRELTGGPKSRHVDAGEIVPGLWGEALYDPEDCTIDPLALLGAYADRARALGVEFGFGEEVSGVEVEGGRVARVRTAHAVHDVKELVVAAGAWAGEVAALAGSRSIRVQPRRRHLFRARLSREDASALPFVWHESDAVYFRPESDGMLVSGCDQEPHPAMPPDVDAAQIEPLAAKLEATFGALGTWSLGPGWACLRAFAGDERFLIGPDPGVDGVYWVAGLGGHGVTASWAVGRLAAGAILGDAVLPELDPRRFG